MCIRNLVRSFRRLYWRVRLGLRDVDGTFMLGGKSSISRDLVAGAYSYIGPGCTIDPGVTIGAYTMLGPGVKIVGNDHVFWVPGTATIFAGRPPFKKTHIGTDVWVGANAVIMAGTQIGDGAIVAAGSVVTKDVPELAVVGGVPAKVIRRRFATDIMDKIHIAFLNETPTEGSYCAPLGANRENE